MKTFDINKLGRHVKFEAVPYIGDTSKACIHIKEGNFEDVVFLIQKTEFDETQQAEDGGPVISFEYKLVEYNEKFLPNFKNLDELDQNDDLKEEIARIMNFVLMSSVARAYEAQTNEDFFDILEKQGITVKRSNDNRKNRHEETGTPDNCIDSTQPKVPE